MSERFSWLWQQLGARRQRQQARRQELRQQRRKQQRLLWGGPVEADRVLAFITAMRLDRLIWLDVTRPQHREPLKELS
jgi:hypothetical protein